MFFSLQLFRTTFWVTYYFAVFFFASTKSVIPLTNARIENPNTPALSPVFGESICAAFCTVKLISAAPSV